MIKSRASVEPDFSEHRCANVVAIVLPYLLFKACKCDCLALPTLLLAAYTCDCHAFYSTVELRCRVHCPVLFRFRCPVCLATDEIREMDFVESGEATSAGRISVPTSHLSGCPSGNHASLHIWVATDWLWGQRGRGVDKVQQPT